MCTPRAQLTVSLRKGEIVSFSKMMFCASSVNSGNRSQCYNVAVEFFRNRISVVLYCWALNPSPNVLPPSEMRQPHSAHTHT